MMLACIGESKSGHKDSGLSLSELLRNSSSVSYSKVFFNFVQEPLQFATNSKVVLDNESGLVFKAWQWCTEARRENWTVLDFGRPSISGSIRSIKMYSWA
jgi:hypothetical protein